jgi:ribosomal protein L29
MHPLAPDFSAMKDEELQKNYNDLYQKYLIAARFGNHNTLYQIQLLIEDYKEELALRQQKQIEQNKDKHNLNDLIKIKK